jgi:uncharacterized membrane protein
MHDFPYQIVLVHTHAMHRIPITLFIFYLGSLLSACAPPDAPTGAINALPETRPGNFLTTRAWQCDANGYVVTSQAKDSKSLWVFLPGQTTLVPPASDNTDGHFLDDRIDIKMTGLNANLRIDGKTDSCIENRPMSIREDAKLRGVDFWATGNEPPWRLEISAATLILKTGYEKIAHEFSTPTPVTNDADKTARYETSNAREHLTINIEGRRCSDSMSGEEFSTTVKLELDGIQLNGCGQALH